VEVGETGDDKAPGTRPKRQWITAREQVAPRGVRDSCEGKALEEGIPGTVSVRNKTEKLG
jgi:hypothetical protein